MHPFPFRGSAPRDRTGHPPDLRSPTPALTDVATRGSGGWPASCAGSRESSETPVDASLSMGEGAARALPHNPLSRAAGLHCARIASGIPDIPYDRKIGYMIARWFRDLHIAPERMRPCMIAARVPVRRCHPRARVSHVSRSSENRN